MTPRAMPLPPEERRAEIIQAALPLLLEHGGRFTTRQVAEAAGVAEGTLFRVFATKRDLMHAVVADAMDPSAACAALDAIDRSLPLGERVTRVLAVVQAAIDQVSAIFGALFTMPTDDVKALSRPDHEGDPGARAHREAQSRALHEAVRRVLEPDAERLSCTPDEAASLLRSLAFATAHPHLSDHRLTDPGTLARLLLDGLLAREQHPGPATPDHSTGTQETPC